MWSFLLHLTASFYTQEKKENKNEYTYREEKRHQTNIFFAIYFCGKYLLWVLHLYSFENRILFSFPPLPNSISLYEKRQKIENIVIPKKSCNKIFDFSLSLLFTVYIFIHTNNSFLLFFSVCNLSRKTYWRIRTEFVEVSPPFLNLRPLFSSLIFLSDFFRIYIIFFLKGGLRCFCWEEKKGPRFWFGVNFFSVWRENKLFFFFFFVVVP